MSRDAHRTFARPIPAYDLLLPDVLDVGHRLIVTAGIGINCGEVRRTTYLADRSRIPTPLRHRWQ